jgi:hypothetical protein
LVKKLLQFVVHGKLFLFAAFLFKPEKEAFLRRIVAFNLRFTTAPIRAKV